jgi:hypothetical protein
MPVEEKERVLPLIKPITPEMVHEEHHLQVELMKKKWGNIGFGGPMPDEERWFLSKVSHALWVLHYWDQKGPADRVLGSFGIPESVRKYIVDKYCFDEVAGAPVEKAQKRVDKYSEFEEWAGAHAGEQFTTEQLVEQSGFSHATTLKYLKESLYFKPIKKGLWEATSGTETKYSD